MSHKTHPTSLRINLNLGFRQTCYTQNKHLQWWTTYLQMGQWAKGLANGVIRFAALRAPGRRARKKGALLYTHLWIRTLPNAIWVHPMLACFPRSGIFRVTHPIQARRMRTKKPQFRPRWNKPAIQNKINNSLKSALLLNFLMFFIYI